jgi:MFS family permease
VRRAPPADKSSSAFSQRRFLTFVVLAGIGFGMTAPLTVLYASSFGASDSLAGVAVSSIAISLLLVDVFGTKLVPRVNGRAAVWFSLTVFGIGSFLSAVAPTLAVMIGARILQGIGAAFFLGGALQVVVRFAPATEVGRAIGALNASWFGGIAVGPFLGGFLASRAEGQDGYRVAFAACGFVCLLVALATRIGLPSIPSPRTPSLSLPQAPAAHCGARLWPPLTLAAMGQAIRGGLVMTIIPLFGKQELGLSTSTVGLALSALAVVDVTSMRVGGAEADRRGSRVVLATALLVGLAVCATAPLVNGWMYFTVWCALIGVTAGVTWVVPAAMVVDVCEDSEAGLGMYRISSDVGQLVGPAGAGALVAATSPVGALVVVTFGLAGAAGWVARLPEAAMLSTQTSPGVSRVPPTAA